MIFSKEYQKTEIEFDEMFKDEESCHSYLFNKRFPKEKQIHWIKVYENS